jgi:hypothetical protein
VGGGDVRPGLALLLWVGMAFVISANGVVGSLVVARRLGEYGGHVYKSLIAVAIVAGASLVYARGTAGAGWQGAAWGAGVLWVCLTVAFEFVAGHYLFGNPWDRLLADYRFWHGRLWTLVVLATLVGPALMGWRLNR